MGSLYSSLKDSSSLKGLSLLLLDAALALLSSAVGLGVSHAEHVVGLNATADTTVAGDGLAKLEAGFLFFNSIEHIDSLFDILSLLLFAFARSAGGEGVLDVLVFASEESGNGLWGDGLLQIYVSIH